MSPTNDCIFCKIIEQEVPAKIEYEDDLCMVFHDIQPKARVHLLVIPKKHIATLKELEETDEEIVGRMMKVAQEMGEKCNLQSYKLLMNVGKEAGQVVFHIHLHVMGS